MQIPNCRPNWSFIIVQFTVTVNQKSYQENFQKESVVRYTYNLVCKSTALQYAILLFVCVTVIQHLFHSSLTFLSSEDTSQSLSLLPS